MAGQAVAGDIGGRVDRAAQRLQFFGSRSVQLAHTEDRRCLVIRRPARQRQPSSERFAEHQHIARQTTALAEHLRRIDHALYREAEDRLGIADRVAAGDRAAGFSDHSRGGIEDRHDRVRREMFGKCGDVDRDHDTTAHCEHIAARVRRGNGAEVVGMIDQRWKEVGSTHHRHSRGHFIDCRVVERRKAHE